MIVYPNVHKSFMDDHIDIDLLSKNFKKNNIPVLLIEDRNALIGFLRKSIPANSVVGVGDSVTLEETGVYDFLRNGTYQFLDKYQPCCPYDLWARESLFDCRTQ